MAHDHGGSDKGAAFTGLIVGAIVLFLLIGAISKMTSAKYAHEGKQEQTK